MKSVDLVFAAFVFSALPALAGDLVRYDFTGLSDEPTFVAIGLTAGIFDGVTPIGSFYNYNTNTGP